jgi:integrase
MPKLGSKGSLQRRAGHIRGVWYRKGARFEENLGTTDKREARARLKALIAKCEAENQIVQETAPPTLNAMLTAVVEHYTRNGLKSLVHVRRHVQTLRRHFRGKSGPEVNRERILAFVDKRLAEDYRPASINRELSTLQLAFSLARKNNRIQPQHVPIIQMLKEDNVRRGFFEQDEFETVRAALPEYLQGPMTLAYWTGVRKQEALSLQWTQVDLAEQLLTLERTKNNEDRIVPLGRELYEMFRKQWAQRWGEFVFHRAGERIRSFDWSWHKTCVELGLGRWVEGKNGKRKYEGRLFHDLRRSGVRNLIRAGVPQAIAQLISGHKSSAIFARYNIVSTKDLAQGMQTLEEYHERKRAERAQRAAILDEDGEARKAPRVQ